VFLYELLTGELPFRGNKRMLLYQVLHDEPRAPRRLNDTIARDLETICLRAMAKEPGKRYSSAGELAEDLRCWLRREPIAARPVGQLERGWRWCKRNPAVAGLLAAVVLLLAGGTTVSVVFAVLAGQRAEQAQRAEEGQKQNAEQATREANRANRNAEEKDQQRKRAEEEEARARERLYATGLSLAQNYWQEGNVVAAREKLDETQEHRDTWEHRYLNTMTNHRGQRTFLGHMGIVHSVCFSPDGRRIASASGDGTAKVWDVQTGRELLSLNHKGGAGGGNSVCYSPDGKRIASAFGDVKVWDAQTGKELFTLLVPLLGGARCVCFSPDGKWIVAGSLVGGPVNLRGLRAIPNPASLIRNSLGGTVFVWDAATGRHVRTLRGHQGRLTSVSFSPDSQRLASGSDVDQRLNVWDVQTGKQLLTFRHEQPVFSVSFSPDGKRLALGSMGSTVKVLDAQTGQEVLTLKGHTESVVNSVSFSPDGERIASGGNDQTVKVWDAHTG
jgi:hypothetical protein